VGQLDELGAELAELAAELAQESAPMMAIRIPVHDVTRAALRPALEALTRINEHILERAESSGRGLPLLYGAGVRYRPEAAGREDWDPVNVVYPRGWGDCEDLAAVRAAELRHHTGERARADTYVSRTGPTGRTWHAVVVREDGTVEDPSALLGMRVRSDHLRDGERFRSDESGRPRKKKEGMTERALRLMREGKIKRPKRRPLRADQAEAEPERELELELAAELERELAELEREALDEIMGRSF
jgi:hypothetical protein